MNNRMDCRLFVGVVCFILMAPSLLADVIEGNSSGNTLYGTENDDQIFGYGGGDSLYGGGGNDTLIGGDGGDYHYGEDGDDTFVLEAGETGYNRFYGGAGLDRVVATEADDVIRISHYNDDVGNESTVEVIDGGAGYNIISAEGSSGGHTLNFSNTQLINISEIHGGASGDTIHGDDLDNIIVGGPGGDYLHGHGGDDTFVLREGETGYNRFYGGAGLDRVVATAADDVIGISRYNDDEGNESTVEVIDGGAGYNIISAEGSSGGHTLNFSNTLLINISEIHGGASGDTIHGDDLDNIIVGGPGGDYLHGHGGDDTFVLREGETGYNRFYGGEGFDRVVATAADDVIGISRYNDDEGNESTVEVIDGGAGYNIISAEGSSGGHTLNFSNTQLINISEIHGGASGDTIHGDDLDNIIVGGPGGDYLHGHGGDDTFVLREGETGYNRFYGGEGFDRVVATAADDVIGISRYNDDEGNESTVEVIDGGAGYNIISAEGSSGGHTLNFSNTQLINISEIHGGASSDTIHGDDLDNIIVGGAGGDNLYGHGGDDTFVLREGETGYNRFYGGEGFDRVVATAADDVIGISRYNDDEGIESTVEVIDGGAGYNIISAEGDSGSHILNFSNTQLINISEIHGGANGDTIHGDDSDNIIVGGLGNDYLYGNGGDDTYQFSAGDGADFIHNEVTGVSGASFDRLITTNIASELLWFNKSGNDLKISIIGSDDQITVDDWYLGSTYQLDEIEASNGRVLASAQVDQLVSAMAAHPIPESVNAVIPQSVLDVSAQTWNDEAQAANVPPVISITSPSANAEYTDGDSVSFTATASDSEDGDISTDINWSSDLDGSLGSGASVNVSTLSVGAHIITVAVVDSASAAANDSIVVTVAASVGDASVVYVSDMPWVTETNGWGVAERDRSNGELAADDGNPITLDGVVYPKGIGAHANSEITIELNGDYEQFTSMVGLDDEINPNGSVVFEIYGDDQPLFQSGVHVSSTAAEAVDISVAGVNTLRLVITNAGDGNSYDHADWADAQLHLPSGYSAPDTIIVAPANNSVTSSGETLTLVGSANDTQDGDVSNSLQWTSNVDGLLGAGTSVSIGTLSIGQHTITATATDSDGTVGNASIVLTVAATPVTPKALISASGSAIIFNEAVSSPSGRLGISNIAYEQLWFSRSGNDLQIDVVGSGEQIIINGWYLGSSYQFDGIEASDGRVLARDQVDQLVNAMAVFAIPEGVGAVIPQSTLDNLLQVWPSVWISSP